MRRLFLSNPNGDADDKRPDECDLGAAFQSIVWEGLDPGVPENVRDILRDLAYDLDFFEPRTEIRSEDGALYGHERVETEIREAFEKLRTVGVKAPTGGA